MDRTDTVNLAVLVLSITLALGMCACDDRRAAKVETSELTKAKGVASVAVIQQRTPTPAPEPTDDTCPNCKGKGKVGDGTVFTKCLPCNGTGKRKSEPQPRDERSILQRFTLDESAFADVAPAVPVRAVVISKKDHCPPCELMKLEIEKQLVPLGWVASSDPADAPDILLATGWPGHGENEGDVYPTTLIQVDGKTVKTLRGYHDWNRLANEINAERKKPRAEKYSAITGGTLQAKDEIGQAIDGAKKFLGDGGSVTFDRPAGIVTLDKATVTFTAQTKISAKYVNDSIVLTCNPPPRIKIAGIPILAPGVNAVTVGRSAITVDLLRWPDVLINVR